MKQRFALHGARTAFAAARAALCLALASLALAAPGAAQTITEPTATATVERADTRADRIQMLEDQLRDATAENERLQYELMQAQREVRRLQSMLGGAPAGAAVTPGQGGALTAAQRGAVGDLAAAAPPQQQQQRPQTPPDPQAAQEAYSRARVLLTNGRHAEAEAAFQAFLRDFGSAQQAEDVRFLLPYTTLARGDYQGAAQGFLDYLQRYRNGARAPEAYARLGMALAGLGRTDDACTAFRQAERHSRANNSVRQLARREAGALSCS